MTPPPNIWGCTVPVAETDTTQIARDAEHRIAKQCLKSWARPPDNSFVATNEHPERGWLTTAEDPA